MKASEVVFKAVDLIADPRNWTRRAYARDEEGFEIEPNSGSAVCFCAIGAMLHVTGLNYYQLLERFPTIRAYVKHSPTNTSLVSINDYTGHVAVLAAMQSMAKDLADKEQQA